MVLAVAHQQAHGDGIVVDLLLHKLGLEVVGRIDGLPGLGDFGRGLLELALARQLDGFHGDGTGFAAVDYQVHHNGIRQVFIHRCVLLSCFCIWFFVDLAGAFQPRLLKPV